MPGLLELDPSELADVPKSTLELAAVSVVQLMVAAVVADNAVTAEITGGVAALGVSVMLAVAQTVGSAAAVAFAWIVWEDAIEAGAL